MERHRREHIDGNKSWWRWVHYKNKRWKQYKIEKQKH